MQTQCEVSLMIRWVEEHAIHGTCSMNHDWSPCHFVMLRPYKFRNRDRGLKNMRLCGTIPERLVRQTYHE